MFVGTYYNKITIRVKCAFYVIFFILILLYFYITNNINLDTLFYITSFNKNSANIANVDQLASVLVAVQLPAATGQDNNQNVLTLSTAKNETVGYFSLWPVMSVPSHLPQCLARLL